MNIVLGSAFLLLTGIFWFPERKETGSKKVPGGFNGGEENMAGSFRNG